MKSDNSEKRLFPNPYYNAMVRANLIMKEQRHGKYIPPRLQWTDNCFWVGDTIEHALQGKPKDIDVEKHLKWYIKFVLSYMVLTILIVPLTRIIPQYIVIPILVLWLAYGVVLCVIHHVWSCKIFLTAISRIRTNHGR